MRVIIDAYNGSSLKEVKSKIDCYKEDKSLDATYVYVFASGMQYMEQLTSSHSPEFLFLPNG